MARSMMTTMSLTRHRLQRCGRHADAARQACICGREQRHLDLHLASVRGEAQGTCHCTSAGLARPGR
jgi:hypothetical protein